MTNNKNYLYMMTNYLSNLKTNRFLILFVGSIALYSCGSYQNSSYYDNDGVYGADTSKKVVYQEQTANTSKYAAQFQSMREEYATEETFTDVSNYATPIDSSKTKSQSYAGWGNNQSNVVVNIYDNWGWNGWYGNPWGWNNWYVGGPRVAFNNGRRGSVNGFTNGANYTSGRYSNRGGVRTNNTNIDQSRRENSASETSIFNQPRISKSEPRTISQPRNNEGTQPRTIPSTPRPRSQETQPRNESYPSTPRNSDYGGGGRSGGFGGGGFGGGGRSGGGGRRG